MRDGHAAADGGSPVRGGCSVRGSAPAGALSWADFLGFFLGNFSFLVSYLFLMFSHFWLDLFFILFSS